MYNNIDFLSGNMTFVNAGLEEDILQVIYPNNYILDLGWYGEENGFILYIIRDCEWSVPVVKYATHDKDKVENMLIEAIARIEKEAHLAKPYYGNLWKTEEIVK